MLFSGYLTIVEKIDSDEDIYSLRIPNYEVKKVFKHTILEWLRYELKLNYNNLRGLAKSLLSSDLEKFEYYFRKIMGDTFSYYDTSKFTENVYQAYVLGLLAILSDDYVIRSNRESGEGRYDILLIPKERDKKGVVIEIKNIEKRREKETEEEFQTRVEKALQSALEQIEEKGYYRELYDYGLTDERILKLPIVFAGKQPFIGKNKK